MPYKNKQKQKEYMKNYSEKNRKWFIELKKLNYYWDQQRVSEHKKKRKHQRV